jgi:hypothetical protein
MRWNEHQKNTRPPKRARIALTYGVQTRDVTVPERRWRFRKATGKDSVTPYRFTS